MKVLLLTLLLMSNVACARENRTRVVVMDTGLNLNDTRFKSVLCDDDSHRDFTGTGIEDHHGHGTHIVGLIVQYAGNANYCLTIYKVLNQSYSLGPYEKGLQALLKLKPEFVNLSLTGEEYSPFEHTVISSMYRTRFVVAAGNKGRDLSSYLTFPASLNKDNMTVVGATTTDGELLSTSNYGPPVDVYELGLNVNSTLPGGTMGKLSGTSQATAITTGKAVKQYAGKN